MNQRHPVVRFHAHGQNAQRNMLVEIEHVTTKSVMVHAFYGDADLKYPKQACTPDSS